MNKYLSFTKALMGACSGVHDNIVSLDYYVIPIIRTLDDLCLERIRHTDSGNLDSKVVCEVDLAAMTDHGKDIWKNK
jgi:hypothetical protein